MRAVAGAAAVLTLAPYPSPEHVSTMPSCRLRRRRTAAARRWRTSRCRGKPTVDGVVDDGEDVSRESEAEREEDVVSGRGVLGWLRLDGVGMGILSIAAPAVLALAADPIAALVDTAFVGHLGSAELAAVGVSISVFNLVSKLFNVPLLNVTTSFVAEQQAIDVDYGGPGKNKLAGQRKSLPAVTTSLALAAGIGLMETVALVFGSGTLMDIIGIPMDSPVRIPAEQFLTFRAYGAPPIIVALAAQGAFRGLMDTKTPLYAIGVGNLVNAILDAILVFPLGLGVRGAALATVTSEYLIACILLWKLNRKVVLFSGNIIGGGVLRYLKSGGLLIGRTVAVLLTMTLSTSLVAREGPVPMAGHQLCLQVWLTISLLNDALALAGQALLATEYTKRNYKQARMVLYRVLQIGGVSGMALAVILYFGFGSFSLLFTDDPAVLDIAKSGVWFVAISQPINAIAFVVDGLYYGVSDFAYAAYSMFFAGAVSSAFLLVVAPEFGLGGVWAGLVLFMSLRAVAGLWRLGSKGGPWNLIFSDTELHDTV
ncbi:protein DETOXIFICATION 44, chloroplastic-like isoform X2 [Lolium rigidum]|uniref:protein DETOXIFICATION 44, chloroplastic-like isoform X2 n=1 Tax=Lolium rigidum TaxID=89674 RepID=UPI001F5D0EBF|nr:protein DETOXIFICATION 44, chloroplastic-like isoform X2 [Lolium rigidum]